MTGHPGDRRHPDPGVGSPPAGYQVTRTEPAVGGGRLQPYRLAAPATFACLRCGDGHALSRRLTVVEGDWLRLLCPLCTTVLAPASNCHLTITGRLWWSVMSCRPGEGTDIPPTLDTPGSSRLVG